MPNYSKPKRVKCSHINGEKDGPLVSAASIRACEQNSNPAVLNNFYPVTSVNVASMLNLPNTTSVQNPINSIIL